MWPIAVVGGLLVLPLAAHADEKADAAEYAKCINMAHTSPADGLAEAMAWGSENGGEPASHCAALAMIGLRQFDEAANRLESLAANSTRSAHIKAGILDQAAQAWMLDKNADRAETDLTKALVLVPQAPDLLVSRAIARADQKKYKEALDDLNQAVMIAPGHADALIFRASAKRHLTDREGAAADLAAALAIEPNNQDAWLEKGLLAVERDNKADAQNAFRKVIELAPDSTAAATARQDLESLDAPAQ